MKSWRDGVKRSEEDHGGETGGKGTREMLIVREKQGWRGDITAQMGRRTHKQSPR